MQLLQNHKVSFVPGWDCHGLPIELKGKFIYRKIYGNARVSINSYSCAHVLDWWSNSYKLVCIHETDYVIAAAVLKSMDKETLSALTPIKLRQKAAKFAKATVDAQMKSFKVDLTCEKLVSVLVMFYTLSVPIYKV